METINNPVNVFDYIYIKANKIQSENTQVHWDEKLFTYFHFRPILFMHSSTCVDNKPILTGKWYFVKGNLPEKVYNQVKSQMLSDLDDDVCKDKLGMPKET